MEKLKKRAEEAGFSWCDKRTIPNIKKSVEGALGWYGLRPDYIVEEKDEYVRLAHSVNAVYSRTAKLRIKDVKKLIEKFELEQEGIIIDMNWLDMQKLWITDIGFRKKGVGIDNMLYVADVKNNKKAIQKIKERLGMEYKLLEVFAPQESEEVLDEEIFEQLEKEFSTFKKNEKLHKWMNDFAVEVMETYYEEYKKSMEAITK